MKRCWIALVLLSLVAHAEKGYEQPPVLKASEILPADLRKSEHHEVREDVRTEGYLYGFEMESDFGLYEIESLALLRIRVHEVKTLAGVIDGNRGSEFFKGLGGRLKQTVTMPVKLVKDPVGTVKGAGKGLAKKVKRIGGLFKSREKSEQEDPGLKAAVIGEQKRKLAAELHLDPYSTNPKVQEFLDEVARARSGGSLVWDAALFAIPGGAGIAVSAADFSGGAPALLRDNNPTELYAINQKKLEAMGIEARLVGQFLNEKGLSPRHKTVITEALERMDGVDDRGAVLRSCLATENEAEALFHEARGKLLAAAHAESKLARFEGPTMPVAYTLAGSHLLVLPMDYVYWSEGIEAIADGLKGLTALRIRLTGRPSARARKELSARGLKIAH